MNKKDRKLKKRWRRNGSNLFILACSENQNSPLSEVMIFTKKPVKPDKSTNTYGQLLDGLRVYDDIFYVSMINAIGIDCLKLSIYKIKYGRSILYRDYPLIENNYDDPDNGDSIINQWKQDIEEIQSLGYVEDSSITFTFGRGEMTY